MPSADPTRIQNQAHEVEEDGTPVRPDITRLREGMGSHQAAAWIEHLEAELADRRNAETAAQAVADIAQAFVESYGENYAANTWDLVTANNWETLTVKLEEWRLADAHVTRMRTGYPTGEGRPFKVEGIAGLQVDVTVEPPS